MEITSLENGTLQLKHVYNSIALKTDSDETMFICMRDSGFEFKYEGQWYSAQNGVIEKLYEHERLSDT